MFSIYIRTHDSRERLALQLYSEAASFFETECKVLNTGAAAADYSEKFVRCLGEALRNETQEYVLILEDDIVFTKGAKLQVEAAIRYEFPYVWFSIPHADVLEYANVLFKGFLSAQITNAMYYSGSILIHANVLKAFVDEYLRVEASLDFKNFDINLSKFLIREFGHSMTVCPSFFGTDTRIQSSLSNNSQFKVEGRFEGQSFCDPRFELCHAVFRYAEECTYAERTKE